MRGKLKLVKDAPLFKNSINFQITQLFNNKIYCEVEPVTYQNGFEMDDNYDRGGRDGSFAEASQSSMHERVSFCIETRSDLFSQGYIHQNIIFFSDFIGKHLSDPIFYRLNQ